MTIEIIVVSLVGLILGVIIGSFLVKKTKIIPKLLIKYSEAERKKNKTLKDPHKLLEKINEHGTIIDEGVELEYAVVDREGVDTLDIVKRTDVEVPNSEIEEVKDEKKPEIKEVKTKKKSEV